MHNQHNLSKKEPEMRFLAVPPPLIPPVYLIETLRRHSGKLILNMEWPEYISREGISGSE